MNHRRLLIFVVLVCLVSMAWAAAPVGAQDCNPDVDLRNAGTDLIWPYTHGVVTNTSASCSYEVGIAAYNKLDSSIATQTLFNSQTTTVGPGQTVELWVQLPNCAAQIDLFYGHVITDFSTGERYNQRLLDVQHVGGTNYCTPPPGNQGCTPGYWKNHLASWSLDPSTPVTAFFGPVPAELSGMTLLDALQGGGGPGVVGGARILLRAAVAGLLNANNGGVAYPWSQADVINQTNAALASGNRNTMIGLGDTIDGLNNSGCPLN